MADDLLDQRQAAVRLGLPSARTLEAWRLRGYGPLFLRLSPASSGTGPATSTSGSQRVSSGWTALPATTVRPPFAGQGVACREPSRDPPRHRARPPTSAGVDHPSRQVI